MEELSDAVWSQMRELVNDMELYLRREEMARNFSARQSSFQQFGNPYPQDQYQFSAQDPFNFQNSDLVLDSYNSACGDDGSYFQQQEVNSYPQPYTPMPGSDFQQVEHGHYPHSYSMSYQQEEQFLDYQPWIQEAGSSWRCSEVEMEDNREEEENALALADEAEARELSQKAEKLEISTSAGKFRIGEELNQEETELIFSPLSAHYQGEIQLQKEEEKVEKELNSGHDSSLRMKSKEATVRYDFPLVDFDSLFQGKHFVLQHGESENQEKEGEIEEKSFPHSPLLRSLVEREVEDFTCEDSYLFLHEESHTMAAQNQLQEEKQEEEATAPSLLEMKAAEPLYPQITSPMHQEEEAENSITSENLPFEFKLTSNQFLLVVNELVSGGELHKKQLNLRNFCKLQPKALFGEVCKRGANGDGVLWNIKVHPP